MKSNSDVCMVIKTLLTCASLVYHVMCHLLDGMHGYFIIYHFEYVMNWLKEHKREAHACTSENHERENHPKTNNLNHQNLKHKR
jgi:hypothetical protein